MSWGIDFKPDIYLSRQSYLSKYDVQDRIDEIKKEISAYESVLKMYVASTPRDIISNEDQEEPIIWLNNRIDDELESYKDLILDKYRLELYLEYLNDIENIDDKANEYQQHEKTFLPPPPPMPPPRLIKEGRKPPPPPKDRVIPTVPKRERIQLNEGVDQNINNEDK